MISRRKAGWANPAAGVSGMPYLPRMGGSSPSQDTVGRANRRAVSRRRVLARVCRGIAALLAAGCALGFTSSGAVAGQVPVILQYSCQLPVVGRTAVTATFGWPSGLQTTTVDTRTPSLPVEVAGTVAPAARTVVRLASIEWIEGTADVSAELMAPQGDISEKVKLTVPRTNVSTGSGPLTVPASGSIPSVLLSQTGHAKVVVGAVVIHLATLTASGALSSLGNLSLSCTLDSGQTGVVASLQILPSASSAAPSSSASSAASSSSTAQAALRRAPSQTPAPTQTPTHAHTPAPGSGPSPQSALGTLLRHSAPLARSYPGFLLLALFILCAAVLVILKAGGAAVAELRGPSGRGRPPRRAPGRRPAEGLSPPHRRAGRRQPAHYPRGEQDPDGDHDGAPRP
jgi:hypothetical protein